jgi:transposase-like protein
METNVLDERLKFVADYESGQWSMTELCERYGVTRPTGYKWLARHRASGRAGLADRSRAPHLCPHRTSDATEALIVEARQEYDWGVKPQRLRKLTVPAVAMSPNRSVAINRTMLPSCISLYLTSRTRMSASERKCSTLHNTGSSSGVTRNGNWLRNSSAVR